MGPIASQITSLTIVYSIVYSDADQRKHQSSASLAFVRGIHRRPVNSPHKWPVTRKMSPFDDVIMLLSRECHRTSLMRSQHWFREWLGAIRHQAITWTNVDPNLCPIWCHLVTINMSNEGREVWSKPPKCHHLTDTVLAKLCLFSLPINIILQDLCDKDFVCWRDQWWLRLLTHTWMRHSVSVCLRQMHNFTVCLHAVPPVLS